MKQMTLAGGTGFEKHGRATRKAEFLARMDTLVTLAAFCALIEPYYPKAGNGRPQVDLEPEFDVRRGKARSHSGRQTHPATFAPAGSNRSSRGGDEAAEAFGVEGHVGDLTSTQAATSSERWAGPEKGDVEADRPLILGRLPWMVKRAKHATIHSTGVLAAACVRREIVATREAPWGGRA